MIDEKTEHLALPLPHPDNNMDEDVARLRAALTKIDEAAAGTSHDFQQVDAEFAAAARITRKLHLRRLLGLDF